MRYKEKSWSSNTGSLIFFQTLPATVKKDWAEKQVTGTNEERKTETERGGNSGREVLLASVADVEEVKKRGIGRRRASARQRSRERERATEKAWLGVSLTGCLWRRLALLTLSGAQEVRERERENKGTWVVWWFRLWWFAIILALMAFWAFLCC